MGSLSLRYNKILSALLIAVVGAGVFVSFALDWLASDAMMQSVARERGAALFRLVQLTRSWNAHHGGVYVPITPDTQPNPYLEHRRRDVVTQDGLALTMVNPAFMTRQIAELAEKANGVRIHITSANPIRPENKADAWESDALNHFEAGQNESIEFMGGIAPVHRYMAPLRVETACMNCHAKQGYQLGQIRGGISVTMPAEELISLRDRDRKRSAVGHFLVFVVLAGLLHMLMTRTRAHMRVLERANVEQEHLIEQRTQSLSQAVAELKQEVVRREDVENQLRQLAHFDVLTGLPNRALFADRLQMAITQSERHQRQCAVCFLDLDHFKAINDTMGHSAGDQLLQQTAHRLQVTVRESDTVARLGGDEFAVIVNEFSTVDEVVEVARRLVDAIAQPFELDAGLGRVSASIGIAIYPDHGTNAETLKINADVAVYRVKARGRNGYEIYTT
jgi:diguanylate cyclase (GGDEF)-like protein